MKKITLLIVIALATAYFISSKYPPATEKKEYENLEIPKNEKKRKEQIIKHEGYTVSYNSDWLIPNWVAYELTSDEVNGTVPRGNDFVPDPEIVGNTAFTEDYKHSGWDRGHMAPAADMKWSKQAMDESFYLSNICPQNHNLNSGDWKELEEQTRDWALKAGSVYIACGPIVNKNYSTIGKNKVAIPEAFFKVFLKFENNTWTAIGFIYENKSGNKPISYYVKSVDEVEKITNLNFFSSLPNKIENEVEKNASLSEF